MNTMAKRRKEFKAALSAENDRTIVDTFLSWLSRGRSFPAWVSSLVVFLLTALLGAAVILLTGELAALYRYAQSLSLIWVVWIVFTLLMCTISMIFANRFFHRVVAVLRDQVVDLAASHETLDLIQFWVNSLTKKQWINMVLGLIGGMVGSAYVIDVLGNQVGMPTGFGLIFGLALFAIQSSFFVGFGLSNVVLALRMGAFDLTLFEADPASSEVIAELSGLFNRFVYWVAVYGAIETFGIIQTGLVAYSVPLLFLFWIPIITIFLASQISLRSIIQRAKWKTLSSIQQKITSIQSGQALLAKEERDTLVWLLDYHERVKATHNSALDWNSGVSFLNSMLLPLIAFILGNIDTVLKLFSGKP